MDADGDDDTDSVNAPDAVKEEVCVVVPHALVDAEPDTVGDTDELDVRQPLGELVDESVVVPDIDEHKVVVMDGLSVTDVDVVTVGENAADAVRETVAVGHDDGDVDRLVVREPVVVTVLETVPVGEIVVETHVDGEFDVVAVTEFVVDGDVLALAERDVVTDTVGDAEWLFDVVSVPDTDGDVEPVPDTDCVRDTEPVAHEVTDGVVHALKLGVVLGQRLTVGVDDDVKDGDTEVDKLDVALVDPERAAEGETEDEPLIVMVGERE